VIIASWMVLGPITVPRFPIGAAEPPEPFVVPGKFSLVPPAGWRAAAVDPTEKSAQLAVFYAPEPFLGVRGHLTIGQMDGVLELGDAARTEHERVLRQALGWAQELRIEDARRVEIGGAAAHRVLLSFRYQGRPIRAVQVLLPGRGLSFIATYTAHADALAGSLSDIEASIRTFRSEEPWWAWISGRTWARWALAGTGAAAVLGVLLVRRRRRLRPPPAGC
jgi:hypothetical protein